MSSLSVWKERGIKLIKWTNTYPLSAIIIRTTIFNVNPVDGKCMICSNYIAYLRAIIFTG